MVTDKISGVSSHMPEQKVSAAQKKKKNWYIPTINYVINRAINSDNKDEVISNINAANGIVDNDTISYVLKSLGKKTSTGMRFPNTLREIDIITPIKERYMGEYIKQYHNYQVYIHDSEAVFERNSELAAAMTRELASKFEDLLQQKDTNLDELDMEKYAKDFVKKWVNKRAVKEQERLNLINDLTESITKYIEGFFYWWATEQVFSYRDVVGNELVKEIVPPWEYYRVDTGELFVEDDDMGVRKFQLNLNQIKSRFSDDLTESDFDYLKTISSRVRDDQVNSNIIYDRIININNFDKKVLDSYDINNTSRNDYTNKFDVYHVVWKTQTKIYVLEYMDFQTNEVKTIDVSEDYKLEPLLGDISKTVEWVTETMEGYRIGGEYDGIYIPARILPVQRQEINNKNICKLPYNGITALIPFNKTKPIPKRLIVYQHLITVYQYQREKAIAKFKAFNLIPESILQDSKDMTLNERLNYANIDDLLPYNDIDIDPQILNGIKSLYNAGAERYIDILSQTIASLRDEAMDAANMNQQRYGDINQRAGKSTTEYAITKATTGSILLFEMFNKFRERDYMADLDWSKAAWVDGKKGSYIDPDSNDPVYVDIDGVAGLGINAGVFIKNSTLEAEKLQQFKELAFSAGQNGEMAIAAESIDATNSAKLKELIIEADEARKKAVESEQQAKIEMEKAITERAKELKQLELDAKTHDIELQEYNENNRQVKELELKFEELKLKYSDENKNVVTDDSDLNEYKRNLDEAKQRIAEQKLELDKYIAIKNQQNQQKQQQNQQQQKQSK